MQDRASWLGWKFLWPVLRGFPVRISVWNRIFYERSWFSQSPEAQGLRLGLVLSIQSPIYCSILCKRCAYSCSQTAHNHILLALLITLTPLDPTTWRTVAHSHLQFYKLTVFSWRIRPLFETFQHASRGWSVRKRQLNHGEGMLWSTTKDDVLGYQAHLKVSLNTLNASLNCNRFILVERRELLTDIRIAWITWNGSQIRVSWSSRHKAWSLKFLTDVRAAWIGSLKSGVAHRYMIVSSILDGMMRGLNE